MLAIRSFLETALAAHGLSLRGGFDFEGDEERPAALSRMPAGAILLIGNVGGAFWPHFEAWQTKQPGPLRDPLDTWSRLVIGEIADQVDARAISPSDRPYLPFQRWAMRAEGLKSSPLGVLMHPEFGLWHAYRGALLFDRPLGLPTAFLSPHMCDHCEAKPCRRQCPVGAHHNDTFAYHDCLSHLGSPVGNDCMSYGCLDRNACPYGASHRYPRALQGFLMSAFSA